MYCKIYGIYEKRNFGEIYLKNPWKSPGKREFQKSQIKRIEKWLDVEEILQNYAA